MHSKPLHSSGFTLLETLMVVTLALILSTVSIAALNQFGNRSGHLEAAQIILGALEEAHARTLASQNDTTYGVHFETTQIVVFEGTTYTASDTTNEVFPLPPKTNITNISLGGDSDVVFERLSGSASTSGTITVTLISDISRSMTLTIYESGLTEITN